MTTPIRRRCGAAAVEFALVAPIIFFSLLATIEMGRAMMVRHVADNAAYSAAREAIVPGAMPNDATTLANDLLRVAGVNGANVTVSPATIDATTDFVTVDISIPSANFAWGASWIMGGRSLDATATLRTERSSSMLVPSPGGGSGDDDDDDDDDDD